MAGSAIPTIHEYVQIIDIGRFQSLFYLGELTVHTLDMSILPLSCNEIVLSF